jgi:hypothetical protein
MSTSAIATVKPKPDRTATFDGLVRRYERARAQRERFYARMHRAHDHAAATLSPEAHYAADKRRWARFRPFQEREEEANQKLAAAILAASDYSFNEGDADDWLPAAVRFGGMLYLVTWNGSFNPPARVERFDLATVTVIEGGAL